MKQPLYQGNQFASSRVPQQAIESQHPMAGLWQRSAAVAAQAGENMDQALIDRQEFTLRQNREAQLRQSMDELNAEMAQRLALADGAEGSFFDANGRLNASAVSEIKRRYGRLSNTWTKGFINPDSIQAATVAQQKYLDSLASSIDSSILSAIRPRAQAAYRRNIDAAVAAGDYVGARRIAREAYDAGQTSDSEFYLATAGVDDSERKANLYAMSPLQLEQALYSDDYKDFFQRNPEVADKIRKLINQRNRTTPSSHGGLRVVRPTATTSAPTTVRAAYNAGRNFYKPKNTPPAAPAEETTTDAPTEETPAENAEPPATTEAPAPDDAAPTETTEEPTETATQVADAGGIDHRMDAPVTPDDGLVPAEDTGEEIEETVTTTSAHGTATGSISLAPDPKAPKPKVENTPAKPPVNSSPFIRDFYQRHGLNFKTPEAQREAAAHFRKWLMSRPAQYLDADENLAEAQAYGKETLHLADNIVKNIIEERQRALSVNVPSFDPNAFLTAATTRWEREYDIKGRVAQLNAASAAISDEDEAAARKKDINASIASIKAYHHEASTQLAAIHDKVLTDYSYWLTAQGQKSTPVQQAAKFQELYKKAMKDFKHVKGLGFLNDDPNTYNTYLDPWTRAPRVATKDTLQKAKKDSHEASAQLHADNARGKANLLMADINATRLLQRATDAITVYASPKGAGGEVPYRILSANTDEAAAARYVIDETLQNQAATVAFSTAAANYLESSELPDTNSRYVFYIPETAAQGDPLHAQPNLLLPLEDGGVLNIELRKTKGVKALTPSRALARRLGILGYQYNAITFDGNCLYFLNREQRPVYGEASIFPTDGEGKPIGLEAGARFEAGALPAATE